MLVGNRHLRTYRQTDQSTDREVWNQYFSGNFETLNGSKNFDSGGQKSFKFKIVISVLQPMVEKEGKK